MLSSNSDSIIPLASISRMKSIAHELHIKSIPEAAGIIYIELEDKAVRCESENFLEACNLWMKAILLRLSQYKSQAAKVHSK